MADINLVTGYRGEVHVSAVDHRNLNAACFGSDEFVTENNAQFSISVRSNNEVRINSGDGIMQGAQFRINEGEYVDLNVENGIAGYKRNDLVVARYTKDSLTGVEKVELAVKKGTATDGTPTDPTIQTGDVLNGEALVNEMKLWRIPIDGLNVGTPVKLFTVKKDFNQLAPEVEKLKSNTRTNLLNPTLGTTTQFGVTCTPNGDGTYTYDGANEGTDNQNFFRLTPWGGDNYDAEIELETGKTYKIISGIGGGSCTKYYTTAVTRSSRNNVGRQVVARSYTDGRTSTDTFVAEEGYRYEVYVHPATGDVASNLIIKTMLTTDLSATYDDFVQYSGPGELNENVAAIRKMIFPIGYIYASTDPTSPAQLFGGTWERIKDCMIYAAGDSDTVGRVVGSNTHTLTVDELPSHSHGLNNHTHSIPALSGATNSTYQSQKLGTHKHGTQMGKSIGGGRSDWGLTAQGAFGGNVLLVPGVGGQVYSLPTDGPEYTDHYHGITTNASTTGGSSGNTANTGGGTAIDMRSARYNTYAWRKIA